MRVIRLSLVIGLVAAQNGLSDKLMKENEDLKQKTAAKELALKQLNEKLSGSNAPSSSAPAPVSSPPNPQTANAFGAKEGTSVALSSDTTGKGCFSRTPVLNYLCPTNPVSEFRMSSSFPIIETCRFLPVMSMENRKEFSSFTLVYVEIQLYHFPA
jgi:hypothetical protein